MIGYIPTEEQARIINSSQSALVIAGPGKGKTATAVATAKAWLLKNEHLQQRVIFTSFSNAAVIRIAESAKIDLSSVECKRLHFRTFHSWAMEILRCYGRFVGLKVPAKAMDNVQKTIVSTELQWNIDDKEEYRRALLEYAKETGNIPFELMLPLATSLLNNNPTIMKACSSKYPFIIVDEFQDTQKDQWRFLKAIGSESRVLVLGDPNQMIYQREHDLVLDRMKEFEEWKKIKRTEFTGKNFRCSYAGIITFAEAMLNGENISGKDTEGVAFWGRYPKQWRSAFAATWAHVRKNAGHDVTLAYIVPSYKIAIGIASDLREVTSDKAIPIPLKAHIEASQTNIDTFRLAVCACVDYCRNPTGDTLQKASIALTLLLDMWGSKRRNYDELLRMVQWRISNKCSAKSPVRELLLSGMAITSIDEFGKQLVSALESDLEFKSAGVRLQKHGVPYLKKLNLGQASLFDGFVKERAEYQDKGNAISTAKTSIVTMSKSKGREFDYVVLLVEPYAHWSGAKPDELRRLYYVAATRARKWLGVIYIPRRLGCVLSPLFDD